MNKSKGQWCTHQTVKKQLLRKSTVLLQYLLLQLKQVPNLFHQTCGVSVVLTRALMLLTLPYLSLDALNAFKCSG